MKVFISADIEGTTGITHWDETEKSKPDYEKFMQQMTREVRAACEGAINAGADEIWIKDAHDSARNLEILDLPENIKIIRGWASHPFMMMQEIYGSFDASIMTGYHSGAGFNTNPLSHTMNCGSIDYVKINGIIASEFIINAYTSSYVNVPVAFVSGDEGLCSQVNTYDKNITTVAVNKGVGNSTISMHPLKAVELIKKGVEDSLKNNLKAVPLPEKFNVEISYIQHTSAYRASFYPGVKQISPKAVSYEANDYMDVLKMMYFLL
jgi:D-amino peptidase